MKYVLTFCLYCYLFVAMAQFNWQSPLAGPTGNFWDMDVMNNKLYVANGWVYEFDGTSWNALNNYNNSLNTPNKGKSCVKAINGKLYCGAKDFNTTGKGDIHYYDGSSWTLFQNADIPYNGDYKIRAFEEFNGSIYMAGKFRLPTDLSYYGLARWNGTEWVNAGKSFALTYSNISTPYELFEMKALQGNLYVTDKSNVWKYDGTNWDSLFKDPTATPLSFPLGQASSMVVLNNELYMVGNFHLSMSVTNLKMIKYDGTTFSAVSGESGLDIYDYVGRLSLVNNRLFFAAHKISDNNTYLVSYDGNSFTELTKLADYGDFPYAKGYEYTNYSKVMYYGGYLWIGGNFQKIGGQTIAGLACTSYSFSTGSGAITQPAAMTVLTPGNSVQFTWSVDNVSAITLEYSENNGSSWNSIVNNIPANNQKVAAVNGQYTWIIPSITEPSVIVRLKDYNSGAELSRTQYTISGVTAITDKYHLNYKIYPNPSAGTLYVEGTGSYVISVINSLGMEEYSNEIEGNSYINLPTLPKGIYMCRIKYNGNVSTEKLMIE